MGLMIEDPAMTTVKSPTCTPLTKADVDDSVPVMMISIQEVEGLVGSKKLGRGYVILVELNERVTPLPKFIRPKVSSGPARRVPGVAADVVLTNNV
jgi:hypothetical protein